jgi:hypothetical protein
MMNRQWLSGALVVFLLGGCGKRTETSSGQPGASPGQGQAVSGSSAASDATLESLTRVVRKFSFEQRRLPKSLDEVVSAGYLNALPPPPSGKRFVLDPKTVQVVLARE